MPIEIKESHIRVAVNAAEGSGGGTAPPAAGSSATAREALIAECVEQVVRILQQKRER